MMYTHLLSVALIVAIFSTDLAAAKRNTIDCATVKILCLAPDCDNPITDLTDYPGQCCPFCPDCRILAKKLSKRDPCNPCTCERGRLTCQPVPCPYIYCENAITPPGQCCQICPK